MIYTTLNNLKKAGACTSRYKVLCKGLGGAKAYGKDTPISYLQILEINGISDLFWALANDNNSQADIIKIISIKISILCSESVLHIYENKFPGDDRPRKAIEAAKEYLKNPAARAAGAAARAARAAGAAARAAGAAADAAAYAAADAARAAGAARAAADARAAAYAAADAARAAGAAYAAAYAAAYDSAYDAAYDTAAYAAADAARAADSAYAAAYAAACAAEREKQINIIKTILSEN